MAIRAASSWNIATPPSSASVSARTPTLSAVRRQRIGQERGSSGCIIAAYACQFAQGTGDRFYPVHPVHPVKNRGPVCLAGQRVADATHGADHGALLFPELVAQRADVDLDQVA